MELLIRQQELSQQRSSTRQTYPVEEIGAGGVGEVKEEGEGASSLEAKTIQIALQSGEEDGE